MAARIFKYPIEVKDKQVVSMPRGAQVLSVQMQNGKLTVWALCPAATAVHESRTFHVFGTGHDLPEAADSRTFVATVQDGNYVWHIFEFK
jgi:hypothetical protein